MLVNLPLTCLVLSHLGFKSCSYLLLTQRLRTSFFCLLLPWLLSLFALGINQMLAVKRVHSLLLTFCPEQQFHQIFSRNPLWYPDTVSEVSSEQGQSLLEVLLHSVSPVCAKTQINSDEFSYNCRSVLPVQASQTKCLFSLQKQLILSDKPHQRLVVLNI